MSTRVRRGIAGLPEPLPPDETLLWQGSPDWWSLSRRAFHVRKVALYFAILIAWRLATDLSDSAPLTTALGHAGWLLIPTVAACVLLSGLAWLSCRSTIFTITDRRVAIRHGIALPVTLNLPFAVVEGAGLNAHGDGTGDVALKLSGGRRIAYLQLWPFARPWHIKSPEPLLRSLQEPERVAQILATALAAAAGQPAPRRARQTGTASGAEAAVATRPLAVN
jgi:hypothetical protein